MSTFHPFPRLPAELRFAMWELIVEPREVEVRIVKPTYEDPLEANWSEPDEWFWINNTRFEAAMIHVPTSTRPARRARGKARAEWKPYQPYVHLTSSAIPAILYTCQEARSHGLDHYEQVTMDVDAQHHINRQYVWLSLERDLINIGTWNMAWIRPIAVSIKGLKLSRETPEEFDHEMNQLPIFINAKEARLVCLDGFQNWGDEVDGFS